MARKKTRAVKVAGAFPRRELRPPAEAAPPPPWHPSPSPPIGQQNRARQELLRELATVEAALRRARPPALVLHREPLIDALLGGFIDNTVHLVRQLEDAE